MRLWAKTLTYWTAVLAIMFSDGSLGWDDILIGIVALPLYFRFIFKKDASA